MTSVHIQARFADNAENGEQPAVGRLLFSPASRHFDKEKHLLIPSPFEVGLDQKGDVTVQLAATDGAFVWMVTEIYTVGGRDVSYSRYVQVPDSTTQVEYADLTDVDPTSFVPVDMTGGHVAEYRFAAGMAEAEEMSNQYPASFVYWFDETTAAQSASAALAAVYQAGEDAKTEAAKASALRASVESTVSDVTALGEDAAAQISLHTASVDEHAVSATLRMDELVAGVESAAMAKSDEIAAAQPDTPTVIPETEEE
ncbi:hypothetical protein DSM100688_0379 [Bifidobacterium ramosum]|uniref:Uncharacterized protein n=1 Tax=Bifidobacterium ramosum TaxID=1798158 RepID=A0A6L4X2E9_9BIFI|nr:hypothetical protein [Bifidobacterium ramosum]KAB8289299.1 hypothetical protein DSM100688_0379 [Bifidobacterium ramosum]NEG71004.1 hypothetical protein [Bifidobacterium ramosum]